MSNCNALCGAANKAQAILALMNAIQGPSLGNVGRRDHPSIVAQLEVPTGVKN